MVLKSELKLNSDVNLHAAPINETSCTHCLVFCSSPYSQPSLSSGISSVMMSPSSKLSSVWLFPDLWGKMVRTLGLLSVRLRPVAIDTDLDNPLSSLQYSRGEKTRQHVLKASLVMIHLNTDLTMWHIGL